MNLTEALEYIHSTCWKGSVPGLSRTEELLQPMGNPHKTLQYIHVVGTNGKGSTCAMLSSILQAAGYKVGLYTSPYIFRFEERMQINGTPISEDDLCRLTEEIRPHADAMEDKPTEFELITCLAFSYFARQKADIVVLEAGMGGEMDSTNVIPAPEVAVVCNIGLDHTEYLGNTLEDIARTKAAVVKEGTGGCVLYPTSQEVTQVVLERCKRVLVPLRHPPKVTPVHADLQGQRFRRGEEEFLLPLLGIHQLSNAAVVLEAVECLREKGWNISAQALQQGLANTYWPGRFQVAKKDPLVILDGGHNPQCIDALVENIRLYLQGRDITVLTGVMADKEREEMYPPLAGEVSRFVTVTPNNPRALSAEDLAAYLSSLGKDAIPCDSVAQGVKTALNLAKQHHGCVLVCGSLYMLGDVAAALEEA